MDKRDCVWTGRIEPLLLAGEEVAAFGHIAACDACRRFGLERGLFPAGCEDPLMGHGVRLYVDLLLRGEPVQEEVPIHFDPSALRAHMEECARCQREVDEAREVSLPPVPRQVQDAAKESGDWAWVDEQWDQPMPEPPEVSPRVAFLAASWSGADRVAVDFVCHWCRASNASGMRRKDAAEAFGRSEPFLLMRTCATCLKPNVIYLEKDAQAARHQGLTNEEAGQRLATERRPASSQPGS